MTSNQRIHVVKVDLSLATIRVRATPPPGGLRTDTFARENDYQIAINGDFGTRVAPFRTSGLAMGDGDRWTDTHDSRREGFLAVGRDNHAILSPPAEVLDDPEAWMSEIVGGRPLVVDEGVALDPVPPWSLDGCAPHFCEQHPRSAVGLSQDGKILILAAIDGRDPPAAVGMTSRQVGNLMREMGAWRALNIDGGGSTTLYVENRGGVVNEPSDGCCRVVSNHIGIEIVEPFGTLHGFVRALDVSDESAGLAGAEVALSTGAAATCDEDGRFRFDDVPAGEVTITATHPGFAPGERVRYVASGDDTWGSLSLQPEDEPGPDPDPGPGPEDEGEGDGEGGSLLRGGCAVARGRGGSWLFLCAWLFFTTRRRGRESPRSARSARDRGSDADRAAGSRRASR